MTIINSRPDDFLHFFKSRMVSCKVNWARLLPYKYIKYNSSGFVLEINF